MEALRELREVILDPDDTQRLQKFHDWRRRWIDEFRETTTIDETMLASLRDTKNFFDHVARKEGADIGKAVIEAPWATKLEEDHVEATFRYPRGSLRRRHRSLMIVRTLPR
jgi:hypothetical protein